MPGKDPFQAYRSYIQPLTNALRCVTETPLKIHTPSAVRADVAYSVTLRDFDAVLLRGKTDIRIRAGHVVRIVEIGPVNPQTRFEARTLEYYYELRVGEREILAFHWKPESGDARVIRFPHLHVGRALTGAQRVIRPNDFHKVHIPTGRVSLESVLRLSITEFGVQPLRRNWDEILDRTEIVSDSLIR